MLFSLPKVIEPQTVDIEIVSKHTEGRFANNAFDSTVPSSKSSRICRC